MTPFHRTYTFWAGLLGLLFLCWILVDSFFNRTFMIIPTGATRNSAVATLHAGSVTVSWQEDVDPQPVSPYGFDFGRRNLSNRGAFSASKPWPPVSYQRQSGWIYTGPPLPAGVSPEEEMERMSKGPSALFHQHIWQHALWLYLAGYLLLWGLGLWLRRIWWRRRIARLPAAQTA